MTHTPGPWTIFGTFNVRGANGRGVATTGGINDGRIADGGFAENSANARLIAAAPDLLAYLQGTVSAMASFGVDLEASRKAIERAIGDLAEGSDW